MTRVQLIKELKLIACGANGGPVVLDDDYFINLQSAMYPDALARFSLAVEATYFAEMDANSLYVCGIRHIEKWSNFETLADAILAEQKRLKAVAKQGT